MKKSIYTVVAFAVFAASALANQATELDVKVPFAFKAGTATLPAGSYRITPASSGFLLIRGEKGGVFVPRAEVVVETSESGKASVLLHRAEDTYSKRTVRLEK
jgi:hypothetical protein